MQKEYAINRIVLEVIVTFLTETRTKCEACFETDPSSPVTKTYVHIAHALVKFCNYVLLFMQTCLSMFHQLCSGSVGWNARPKDKNSPQFVSLYV